MKPLYQILKDTEAENATLKKALAETEQQLLDTQVAIAELDMQRSTDKTEIELAVAELAETLLGGGQDG